MIDKRTIKTFFEDLAKSDKFDENSNLLWGFFFLDTNKEKLKKISEKLSSINLEFVDIFEAEMEDNSLPKEYYLHLQKKEHHTEESLLQRNEYLYQIAKEFQINAYDGFDVGN